MGGGKYRPGIREMDDGQFELISQQGNVLRDRCMKPSLRKFFDVFFIFLESFWSVLHTLVRRSHPVLSLIAPPRFRIDPANPIVHLQSFLVLVPNFVKPPQNIKEAFPAVNSGVFFDVSTHPPFGDPLVPSIKQNPDAKDKKEEAAPHESLTSDKLNNVTDTNGL
jgi:hypothetical protein